MLIAPPDAVLAVVAERLTFIGIVAHAKPVVMLVLAGLAVSTVVASLVWIGELAGRTAGRGGRTFLHTLTAAGPLIGLFGAAYGLMDMFIGISNVRPTPALGILAPGFAEALLSVTLGLLAGAIAMIGHRHLTARLQAADVKSARVSPEPGVHAARALA
jgi:hypothetical protein